MKNAFCLLALLFLTACAAPPIYITPKVTTSLNKEAATTTEIFDLEITELVVGSYVDIDFPTYPLPGGTGMGYFTTTTTEYCVIKIDSCVKTPSGEIILEGRASERTAECQLPHLNQSKLANAVSGVQQHLVDYIRGRMPSENIYGSDSIGELSKSVNIQEPLPLGIRSVVI